MPEQLRTVRLYGKLGARFGRVWKLAVSSPADAVRALSELVPGFKQFMVGDTTVAGYLVFTGKKEVSEDELLMPGSGDIRIAPVLQGAKSKYVTLIVGAVLIVVGAILTFTGIGSGIGVPMMKWGAGLMISGVISLLIPMPKASMLEEAKNSPSYVFNGPINTQAQGNCVPLCYGRMFVGSAVISASISVEDQSVHHSASGPGVGGGGSVWDTINRAVQQQ